MKKLGRDLKRMLNALAHQDAGEFLSRQDKMRQLGHTRENRRKQSETRRPALSKSVTKRIALITDGSDFSAPIEYAIDACQRQHAVLDLLYHDAIDKRTIPALERQIRQAGVECKVIKIVANVIDEIIDLLCSRSSLVCVVSSPEDSTVKILMQEMMSRRRIHFPIPLVLIGDRKTTRKYKQSAA